MYPHEMEAGKPKPASPEDVTKLEARAKSNPSLRPPSKPPPKSSPPAPGILIVKMLHVPGGPVNSFDFAIFLIVKMKLIMIDSMIVRNLQN